MDYAYNIGCKYKASRTLDNNVCDDDETNESGKLYSAKRFRLPISSRTTFCMALSHMPTAIGGVLCEDEATDGVLFQEISTCSKNGEEATDAPGRFLLF